MDGAVKVYHMPIADKRPHGLLRLGFRLPIWLYRFHLGWMLGERFLLLTHTGRKSGLLRQTVIEVVRHDKSTGTYFVASGFGFKSDWFLNIKHNPNVAITVGQHTTSAQARQLSEGDGAKELFDYGQRHPTAFKELSRLLIGKSIDVTEENCRQFSKVAPLIAFEPR